MTTPALCQPAGTNSIYLAHLWNWRTQLCRRCGCALPVPKKAVDDKPEKSKDHHAAD